MTAAQLSGAPVLVVGAGIMGIGIAQLAAQAGHPVLLFDNRAGAAAQATDRLAQTLQTLAAKGKLSAEAAAQIRSRIAPIAALDAAASARLVVEAIVEQLDVKRALFRQLEALVDADCVLATNTSSLSVTAMGNGLQHPGRLVGMHFFNPVPLMKLVEVVSGLQTDPAVAAAVFELAGRWGKVAVHARSTPGFIVNRIARPYYAETLALLQEQAAPPAVLDACLRAAGFRMGPCELMDLIGHDTNFSVTQSVFEANFFDKRFVPSLVQRELVDGGLLGRKSGRGFYHYGPDGATTGGPEPAAPQPLPPQPVAQTLQVHGQGQLAQHLVTTLTQAGHRVQHQAASDWVGLAVAGDAQLRLTDGRLATQLGAQVAVFDLPLGTQPGATLAWAGSAHATPAWLAAVPGWLAVLGWQARQVADTPALVVARTIAMLINEASDAVHQGVCSQAGADAAMKLGVNYPAGPFEWLAHWPSAAVIRVLDALAAHYGGERYRVSPRLRLQGWHADLPASPLLEPASRNPSSL